LRDGDRRSGAGLGLSICRGIVRAHGGEITAHAGLSGSGTLIRIRLPDAGRPPRGVTG
jgi:signal transduction histidine kinase